MTAISLVPATYCASSSSTISYFIASVCTSLFLVLSLGLDWTRTLHQKAFVSSPRSSSLSGYPPHHTLSLFLVFCLIRPQYLAPVDIVACRVIRSGLCFCSLSHITILILNQLFLCKNSCIIIVFHFLLSFWAVCLLKQFYGSLKPKSQTLDTATMRSCLDELEDLST